MIALEEIQKLIDLMKTTGVMELSVENGDIKVFLRRSAAEIHEKPLSETHSPGAEEIAQALAETLSAQGKPHVATIVSPLVGIFHNGGMSDRRTVLHEGDTVKEGQLVAVVEAMKVPTELRSPIDGIVNRILVDDGMGVEYGQTLLLIEP